MAVEEVGMGREQVQHFGETTGGQAVFAADRALLEMKGASEAVRGERLIGHFERLRGRSARPSYACRSPGTPDWR